MEVSYNQKAVNEYLETLNSFQKDIQQIKEDTSTHYNQSLNKYSQLCNELENRKQQASIKIDNARSTIAEGNTFVSVGRSLLSNSVSPRESIEANAMIHKGSQLKTKGNKALSKAQKEFDKIQEYLKQLDDIHSRNISNIVPNQQIQDSTFSFLWQRISNIHSDFNTYADYMKQAENALSGTDNDTSYVSNGYSSSQSVKDPQYKENNKHHLANNTIKIAAAVGGAYIAMNILGKQYDFPYSKSGLAKAYRTALQSGDENIINTTREMFDHYEYNNHIGTNTSVEDIASNLENNIQSTLTDETVRAAAMNRKMITPNDLTSLGKDKGQWSGNTFILDDSYVPEKYNPNNLNMSQIKNMLKQNYNIDFEGITYSNVGTADFSQISVAQIPIRDMISHISDIDADNYDNLSQKEKIALLDNLFSDDDNQQNKRERNFRIADEIASSQHISIPGLRQNYTSRELCGWRRKNRFTWDEQLDTGYNLVPSIIHGNLPHTGLVGISKQAHTFISAEEEISRNNPNQRSWDNSSGHIPISISELEQQ